MSELSPGAQKRPVLALELPDVVAAQISTQQPELRIVAPGDLYVDDTYQRSLSDRSIRLIKKIVSEWDWRAFKPPVVVEVDGRLEIIDGQHTAIAAATHGGIASMPVLVVEGELIASRANAFVRHNRDRIQVTATQLHTAMVAAGDEDALTLQQVCERSGARVLKSPAPLGRYEVGDLVAVTSLRALVNRRHAIGARKVLEVCVKSGAAPISAGLLKAVEYLLFAPEYKDEIAADRIAMVISASMSTIESEAERFAAERKVPVWRALASVIFMHRRRRNA